jgi:hypothetical protein
MRALVLTLVLVNVLFFCWAHWIDPPAGARAPSASIAALRLAPPLSAAAAKANAAPRCASFGPLTSREALAAVGTALRARSYNPRERATRAEAPDGYWVYIDNLSDSQAQARALKRLARAGVRDAAALATNGQVSVGLFSEHSGAELRATAVRAAGLEPIIKARIQVVDEYWYDVDSASEVSLPAVAVLMAGINVDTTPAWSACPVAAAPAAAPVAAPVAATP